MGFKGANCLHAVQMCCAVSLSLPSTHESNDSDVQWGASKPTTTGWPDSVCLQILLTDIGRIQEDLAI